MNTHDPVSDEQLNALIDNELDADERNRILTAVAKDSKLQLRYNELRRIRDMVVSAYRDVPQPQSNKVKTVSLSNRYYVGFASAAMLLVGLVSGWFISKYTIHSSALNFRYVEQLDVHKIDKEKVLLQIDTNVDNRVQAALQSAQELLDNSRSNHTKLKLEIVANAKGLSVLRKGSPYANKIASLAKNYHNVKFLACGVAKQNAALKEGKPIELLPEAQDIPAALDQILHRLQEGWTYLRS
jgi:intracellular sulfur oxidation DsrE/DsrF family protein